MSTWITTAKGLHKKLQFTSEVALNDFLDQLQHVSDEQEHHADLEFPLNNELNIYLLTHDANAITYKDYFLAERIDVLFEVYHLKTEIENK